MAYSPSKPIARDTILTAIRSAVKDADGRHISKKPFFVKSKIRPCQFYKYFANWNEALRAAGFDFDPRGQGLRLDTARLLADWGSVTRKLGRIPTVFAYDRHGKYCAHTFTTRLASWVAIPSEFRNFAKGKSEWADVVALCNTHARLRRPRPPAVSKPRRMRTRPDTTAKPNLANPITGRPTYGAPLNLPGLGNAPVNESGVIFLFGILAAPLGFHVQALRTAFPDCEARRQVGSGQWQTVTIEFEYESRNFSIHGHDPKGCDLIVCWNHNWEDCPKNLEVIALSEEIKNLHTSDSRLLVPA